MYISKELAKFSFTSTVLTNFTSKSQAATKTYNHKLAPYIASTSTWTEHIYLKKKQKSKSLRGPTHVVEAVVTSGQLVVDRVTVLVVRVLGRVAPTVLVQVLVQVHVHAGTFRAPKLVLHGLVTWHVRGHVVLVGAKRRFGCGEFDWLICSSVKILQATTICAGETRTDKNLIEVFFLNSNYQGVLKHKTGLWLKVITKQKNTNEN